MPKGSWWSPCEEYRANVARFTRTDALLAFALVVLSYAALFFEGLRSLTQPPSDEPSQIAQGLVDLAVWTVLLVGVVVIRKQGAWGLGLGRVQLWASLRAGVVVAGIVIAVAFFIGLVRRLALPDVRAEWFTWGIPYYLLVIGLNEELLWRGFVTPRLSSLWRRRWVGVAVSGVLFGLSHIPFHWMNSGLGLGEFLTSSYWMVLIPMLWHLPLWWLYSRWNSLLAPTLLHFAMNWSSLLT